MDRKDFLEGLRGYLEPEVSAQVVQENMYYYERYITEEVVKGRREEEIVEELGDPWILAKTIIDMEEAKETSDTSYEANNENVYNEVSHKKVQFQTFWRKLLFVLGIMGVIFMIFLVITGLIRLFIPILFPVMLVVMVYRLLFGKKRY